MVEMSDLTFLERNCSKGLAELVKNFFQNKTFEEPNVSSIIEVDENDGYQEAWWIRATKGFKNILSKTYLGRVENYAF